MQNQYDGILQFKGKWRVYQERVLTNAETYLSDHKVHIVAAPGSGKTTLGIELIRRLGAPCLILSPSITIRQQWLERITDSFLLPGNDPTALLSNDLKQMKAITAITYQALYSAMKQMQGQLSEEDETEAGELSEKETVDFRDFRIFDAVRAAGYDPMIYCNLKWMAFTLDLEQLTGYDFWYADYYDIPQCPYDYKIWQYSETGVVPGINGNVDLNLWFQEGE